MIAVSAIAVGGVGTTGASALEPPSVAPVIVSSYRTPNDWGLTPAGQQVDTRRTPDGVAVSPDGKTVFAVANSQLDNALTTIDANTLVASPTETSATYFGAAADSSNVWVSGGFSNKIYQVSYARGAGAAVPTRQVSPFPGSPDDGIPVLSYPGNMALDQPSRRLFVAGSLSVPSSAITAFDPSAATCTDINGSATSICSVIDVVDVSNTSPSASPHVHLVPVGRDAYGMALNPAHKVLYVTNMADQTSNAGTGTVSVVNVATPGKESEVQRVKVGSEPLGVAVSPDGSRVVVANSAMDTITVVPVASDGTLDRSNARTDSVRAYPGEPLGATPTAVAYSPDGKLLYVALAGQNAIQVRNADGTSIPQPNLNSANSYIATGWYPDALAVGPNPSGASGSRLYVSNLKGLGMGPGFDELISGVRSEGNVSVIDVPDDAAGRASMLASGTTQVIQNNNWAPLLAASRPAIDACTPAPLPGGGQTQGNDVICQLSQNPALRQQVHVVYIVKENKTFDQYFGDIQATLPGADANPTWLLYGEPVTTNQHRLARQFALSDHFWADSEQSTTGHSWTSAAYSTAYNELFWATSGGYDEGLRGNRESCQYTGQRSGPTYPGCPEGSMYTPKARLVDEIARTPGLSERIYSNDVDPSSPAYPSRIPLGEWGFNGQLIQTGSNLEFPDTDRANLLINGTTISNAWDVRSGPPPPTFGQPFSLSDPAKFSLNGPGGWTEQYNGCIAGGGSDASCQASMPNFLYVSLPVDHTLGFDPMTPTPASMVANNDYATGMVIDALSHTPFWKNTLIFITEDDTQASGDHVDGHRTFLLSSGGLASRLGAQGQASHQEGSFPSVLKTVEDMFGLRALTIYDRGAHALHDVVVDKLADANTSQYTAVQPPTPFLRNPPLSEADERTAQLEKLSLKANFWNLDLGNPVLEHDVLYAGLRGTPLPSADLALIGP
jgi:DNA-binding beta-propeller fold protein YncE